MRRSMVCKKFLISTVLFLAQYSSAWQIIPVELSKEEAQKEKVRESDKSFSFPVNAHLDFSDRLIVTAKENNTAKNFSLSFYDFVENVFKPIALEKVKVNGVADQKNPLFDCSINHIAMMDEHTFALTSSSEPKQLFALSLPDFKEVLSSGCIKDASGQEIESPISALAGGQGRAFGVITSKNQTSIAVFAVHVENKEIQLTLEEFEQLKKYVQEQGDEQLIEQFTKEITTKDGKRFKKVTEKKLLQTAAVPLCKTSDLIKIGNDVCALEIADMHWNENLKRLFIGLKITGNECSTDGVCALLVGRLDEGGNLVLSPGISPELVCSDNQIVASKKSNAEISIHQVRSMLTTTALDYSIVLGGNGNAADTRRTVFALPVLNFHTQNGAIAPEHIGLQGTLADNQGVPLEGFSDKSRSHLFLGRHFVTPAQSANNLCTNETKGAQVGGGALGVGPIDEIFVRDDAVYAIVSDAYEGYNSGVYYSQAIFDASGRIAAWTQWQPKALVPDETITSAYVDRINGSLVVAAGADAGAVRTVKRTQWVNNQLTQLAKLEFPQSKGGIQGLIDFPAYTPGLNQHMLIITGFAKLLCAQTSDQLRAITFNDEVLQKMGPLSCAEIIYNYPYGWLITGGVNGLAILCADDGAGWHVGTFDENFLDLPKMLRFKNIGDYQFVRKIIADEQFLYVLTDTKFDRIDITASDFNSGRLSTTRLAEAQQLTDSGLGIFIDVIVSEKCAFLISTSGLYRIANGQDIRFESADTLSWVPLSFI